MSLLQKIADGIHLDALEAEVLMLAITEGKLEEPAIENILHGLNSKEITTDEVLGFINALMQKAVPINLSTHAIDVCGTGGDGKNTFNISTLTAITLACMQIPVVKHGNYAVSSNSGSSTVLELMGYEFTNHQQALQDQLGNSNFVYLHAPLFHPALKTVAPVRKKIGTKTVFNLLGPLLNPAQPNFRLNGTYNGKVTKIYKEVYDCMGKNYACFNSQTGYDEITLTDECIVKTKQEDIIINNASFKVDKLDSTQLLGGNNAEEGLQIFQKIINGNGTKEQSFCIAANVAVAAALFHNNFKEMQFFFEEAVGRIAKKDLKQKINQLIK
jgi:anthranilate phosphoribosyltransferase